MDLTVRMTEGTEKGVITSYQIFLRRNLEKEERYIHEWLPFHLHMLYCWNVER